MKVLEFENETILSYSDDKTLRIWDKQGTIIKIFYTTIDSISIYNNCLIRHEAEKIVIENGKRLYRCKIFV